MAHQYGMQTARDIPLIITSAASSSERRITPSWTIAHLKAKLESVTGISPSSQKLLLRLPNQPEQVVEATDEETVRVEQWQLADYAELHVRLRGQIILQIILQRFSSACVSSHKISLKPLCFFCKPPRMTKLMSHIIFLQRLTTEQVVSLNPQASNSIPSDLSRVPKYTMPAEAYEALPSTVLAYKKSHHIGRFDPNLTEIQQQKVQVAWEEIKSKSEWSSYPCRAMQP